MNLPAENPQPLRKFKKYFRAYPTHLFGLISLAIIIASLVIRNDGWLFTQAGWLDPWVYVGYGYDYADPRFLAGYYKISRLPWVLTEYSIRQLLTPVLAQYVMQIGCLFGCVALLYLTLRRITGEGAAFIGAAFLATLTVAHGAGGADYNTGVSGFFFAASYYLLTDSVSRRTIDIHALAFGIAFAATLHTNFIYANLIPALAIHFVFGRVANGASYAPSVLVRFLLCAVAGALAITVVLATVNWLYGREFLFFVPLMKYALSFLQDSATQKPWWKPWGSYWFIRERYFGLLFAGTVLSAAMMLRAKRSTAPAIDRLWMLSLNAQFLCTVLVWILWQTVGQTSLQPPYFVYPLWLQLAAVVASACMSDDVRTRRPATWLILVVGVLAFSLQYSMYDWFVRLAGYLPKTPMIESLAAYGLTFLVIIVAWRFRNFIYPCILLLAVTNSIANETPEYYVRSNCPVRRDGELAIIAAHQRLAQYDPAFAGRIFIWHSISMRPPSVSSCAYAPINWYADSIAFTGFKFLDEELPFRPISQISSERIAFIAASDPVIVVLTTDVSEVETLRQRFKFAGKLLHLVEQIAITQGSITLPIYVLE